MPDVFTKAKRSEVMSRIRPRGNKDTELALMRVFRMHSITGWRGHVVIRSADFQIGPRRTGVRRSTRGARGVMRPAFAVRPDFIFPKLRLAVVVDERFWHGRPGHKTKLRSNAAFWRKKFAANKARDRLVNKMLRIWDHELARKHETRLFRRIHRALARA